MGTVARVPAITRLTLFDKNKFKSQICYLSLKENYISVSKKELVGKASSLV